MRHDQKVSASVLWELFLNILSLCLDALSTTLFQFAYPFKIEAFFLVPEVLINSICEAFIAPKNAYHEDQFSYLETDRPAGAKSEEYERGGSRLRSCILSQQQ